MDNMYKMTYNVDMVFCIDATESMGGVLDIVKTNALNFYPDVKEAMAKKNKRIDNLRIRVVAFRDYVADGSQAMLVTNFFDLPGQSQDFADCIHSIEAKGGGDEPEDGLEALAYAIRSDWDKTSIKRRQVIVVWTDASTHNIGYGRGVPSYPNDMPFDFNELSVWWGDRITSAGYMDQSAKRLLLFSPDAPYWNIINNQWNSVIHNPSIAGNGLNEYNYEQILNTIANSV